jgi:hypothetical protein
MKKYLLYILIFILSACGNIYSQDSLKSDNFVNYGAFSNYNYQIHNTDFQRLPGIPNCCPDFTEGYSKGFSIGGVYQYLFPVYGFEVRAGLDFIKGNFTSGEDMVFAVNDAPFNGRIDHIVDFNLSSLSIDASFKYEMFDKINFSVGLGLSAFYNSSYNQYEKISIPEGKIYFIDTINNTHKSVRNEKSGEIPKINVIQAYSIAKIGYNVDLKKDKSLILSPEVAFNYYFSNMIKDLEWNTLSLKFGISLQFSTQKYLESDTDNLKIIPLEQQLAQIRNENEELKKQNDKINSDKIMLEELIKKEQTEKITILKNLAEKENLLKIIHDSSVTEQQKIETERDEFNKMIDDENKKTGKICNCYVILFASTTDKNEADNLFNSLKNNKIENINIISFVEPYLKNKYYRVQSKCYSDPNEAFDNKLKIQFKTNLLNIVPQILCNK